MKKNIEFMKPLGLFDYVKLQMNAYCVISDSGTITEESSILQFPAITIRQAHERPEGMDEGVLIMTGLKKDNVIESIEVVVSHAKDKKFKIVEDYDVENFSKKSPKLFLVIPSILIERFGENNNLKKLLILGKSTMAGHVIKKFFKEKKEYSVVSVDENKVFDKHGLNSEVFYEDYDCIINCIRCLVEESRINPTKAILYNAYLPNFLADFFLTKKKLK